MKESVVALPSQAHVDLRMVDGSSLRGRIISRAENDFTLKRDRGGSTQTISYQQVRSVSQVEGKHSKAKWIIIGVVAGAAVAVAIIGIHIVHQPAVKI